MYDNNVLTLHTLRNQIRKENGKDEIDYSKVEKSYVRFQITTINEDGEFRDLAVRKLISNLEVFIALEKLLPQENLIHKIRVTRHKVSKRVIGICIQVMREFNIQAYDAYPINVYDMRTLYLNDRLTQYVDLSYLSDWQEILNCLRNNRQLLRQIYAVNPTYTQDERVRKPAVTVYVKHSNPYYYNR